MSLRLNNFFISLTIIMSKHYGLLYYCITEILAHQKL